MSRNPGAKERAPRPALLVLAALPIAAAAGLAACRREPPRTPPQHVVLLVVDTLRADRLSCYGYPRPTSPAIDALAAEGVRFSRAISQSSWTSPSMVSMLTSRHIAEETLAVPDDRPTVAERFRAAGYATAAFITNDLLSRENRFDRGFDEFEFELEPYGSNAPILDWFARKQDARTFTFLHLAEPHDDAGDQHAYRPPEEFRRWQDAPDNVPPELAARHDELEGQLGLVEGAASRAWIAEQRGAYDDDVACLDARVAEIFAALEANGMWAKTAVVLAADHGEGLWEYVQFPIGTRAKVRAEGEPETLANTLHQTHGSHVTQQLLHVPLIVRAPGLAAGVVDCWVENLDVAPTLLALAGLPPIEDAHGKSLLALAAEPDACGAEPVFAYTRYNSTLIGQDGVQAILPTARGECEFSTGVEFYDLGRDPLARTNLVSRHQDRIPALERGAAERLRAGIVASREPLSAVNLERLASLGYLGSGVFDDVRAELRELPVDELVGKVIGETDCLLRLEAVRALAERDPELDEAERALLEKARAAESSRAVRDALARFLR